MDAAKEQLKKTVEGAVDGAIKGTAATGGTVAGAVTGAAVGAGVAAGKPIAGAVIEGAGLIKDNREARESERRARIAEEAVKIKKENPDKPVSDCYEDAERNLRPKGKEERPPQKTPLE